jgi:hypothetical protein
MKAKQVLTANKKSLPEIGMLFLIFIYYLAKIAFGSGHGHA